MSQRICKSLCIEELPVLTYLISKKEFKRLEIFSSIFISEAYTSNHIILKSRYCKKK